MKATREPSSGSRIGGTKENITQVFNAKNEKPRKGLFVFPRQAGNKGGILIGFGSARA